MIVSEHKDHLKSLLLQFYESVKYYQEKVPDMGIGQIADGFIKNELDMEKGMKDYGEWINELHRRNKRLLKAVKNIKGKTFHKRLVEYIKDQFPQEYTPWEIVREPVGEPQSVTGYGKAIKKEWVQQWATGTEGDTWDGIICIELKPGRYLKFYFSC